MKAGNELKDFILRIIGILMLVGQNILIFFLKLEQKIFI